MSETTTRSAASRGRGSGRGGRGGFAGRGGRRPNGDKADKSADDNLGAFDDEGDLGELRKQYGDKTSVIREMFPDWSEADVLFALQETNGDQTEAVTRIAEGTISQWGEVSKAKKPSRPKAEKSAPAATSTEQPATSAKASRGGRTVSEGARGRGRATERGGRGAARARPAQPSTNGARNKENQQLSVPTEESSAWGDKKAAAPSKPAVEEKPAPEPQSAAPGAKTWASMLRQSTVPKPAPKEAPKSKPAAPTDSADDVPAPGPAPTESKPEADNETTPVADRATPVIDEPALPPSKDHLTETNLEQVVDDSRPPATGTAASTAADSWDPRQSPISSSVTPNSAAQQQHQSQQRVPLSGYAASAMKATTDRSNRTPSYQRRVLDQEEAVRMPGNREVDRAAVQFGAFNLSGGDEEVDGEREDAETRAQPPGDSPVAQPRTSLPPVSQHAGVPDVFSKGGAGAPGVQPAMPSAQQFNRFGQAAPQEAAAPQKPLDPFSQQATPVSQPPFDSFPATTQPPAQAAFSSAPGDYTNYYTANQQDRNNPYNYYGQHFGQQQGIHAQHDAQQRMAGYNASQVDSLSQYPQSGSSHTQPRFGAAADAQNSGHSTPNPTAQAQQQAQQVQQAQQQQAQAQAQGAPGSQLGHGQYPGYNHPYYPYYQQYYSGYGQGGFGPYGKGGMYGQPYGVAPNAPYDHAASSPANFGPSNVHRDSGLGSGLGDYGRAATTQSAGQPGLAGSGFGGSHDSFARGGSSFQSQGQSFNSQNPSGAGTTADDLKSFGDAKPGAGPSPSLGGARPGSVTNTGPSAQGSGLPPPQASQMGAYGGYPGGHNVHGSGAYGMGGAAAASQHGNTPYGSYGQGFGSGGYYGGGQQRGGWGGNYH